MQFYKDERALLPKQSIFIYHIRKLHMNTWSAMNEKLTDSDTPMHLQKCIINISCA